MEKIVLPAIINRTTAVRNASVARFNRKNKIVTFDNGSLVALASPILKGALDAKYHGPYKIVGCKGGAYSLLDIRLNELLPKTYPPSALKSVSKEPNLPDDDEKRWEVESIINHRGNPNNYEYKVRWVGFNDDWDTWEPAENFDDADTIARYWQRRGVDDKKTRVERI
ncbi:hypothetical protein DM01DRAFT_259097 [Hesseltinella vesiculosa]|uniref:Chromo domain-containing protein n=1 Tax=Hesseltinella vesiculosa TaxID=101127 RepID=A0A1X2G368_9FUNG|nr:hypothetical protein DM01DRAFT_259097 [Hesseltinella vesiculosa]